MAFPFLKGILLSLIFLLKAMGKSQEAPSGSPIKLP